MPMAMTITREDIGVSSMDPEERSPITTLASWFIPKSPEGRWI